MKRKKDGFGPRRKETEHRRITARTFYDFEMECRRQNWGDPAFVYVH